MLDYVIKFFKPVDSDEDLLIEELEDHKEKVPPKETTRVSRDEDRNFFHNLLVPTLKKLGKERKSLAKLEIHRILHNIEFQTALPSMLPSNNEHSQECNKGNTSEDEDEAFCFSLVVPILNRLDEERKSLAVLEIQRGSSQCTIRYPNS